MGQLVPTKAVLNWLLASALVAHSHPLSGAQQCTGRVPTVRHLTVWRTPPNGQTEYTPNGLFIPAIEYRQISVEFYPLRFIRRGSSVEGPLGHG